MPDYGVIPSIRVADMAQALTFYESVLGFRVRRGGPSAEHCSLERGSATIMLEAAAGFYSPGYNAAIRERMGSPSAIALNVQADDLEKLLERVAEAGATIIDPLADREWGQTEFTVEDPEGNWLTFWRVRR